MQRLRGVPLPCIAVLAALVGTLPNRADANPPAAESPRSVLMENGGAYRVYHHERRRLPLDASRVAVQRDPSSAEAATAIARAHPGLNAIHHALPICDWSLVETDPASRADADVREIVRRLAADPAVAFTSPVFIGDDGGPVIITSDVLIGFDAAVPDDRAEIILRDSGIGVITDRRWAGMAGAYRVRAFSRDGFEVLAAANALAERADVRYAEPDMIFTGRGGFVPNDPDYIYCWGLHNTGQFSGTPGMDVRAQEAWDVSTGSASILVVVIDTGVDQTHPDINQIAGTDTTSDGPGGGGPVNACDNHGTWVAGCVSGRINNSLGGVGVAPGCRVGSARTFISNTPGCNGSWTSQSSWTVNSLAWAQSIGARVTNNSNYYGFTSSAIETKYADTRTAGIVHFASAGNDASTNITYPANLPTVNAVAALAPTGLLASFSTRGVGLDFSAPGQTIRTTDRAGAAGGDPGDYVYVDGTSFASPYAAGVAALVLSRWPALTAANVEKTLQLSCSNLGAAGYDTTYGWGLVNAQRALTDCDTNATPDVLDLFNTPARDCNTNATPDACELTGRDCNTNGSLDLCELAGGMGAPPVADCNTNATLDACDLNVFATASPTNAAATPIPDLGAAASVVIPTQPQFVTDANVQLRITHTAAGNLDLSVSHLAATVLLASALGGSGDHYTNTVFDQQAVASITAAAPPFAGTFRPQGNLSAFNGLTKLGPWTLTARDAVAGDTGTLLAWTLIVQHRATPDCNTDGTPDICQMPGHDCNTNNSLDACEAGCNTNGIPDACEIAGRDCNTNGTPDACELASGMGVPPVADCNTNATLDACETDANSNGTVDACEICPTCPGDANGDARVDGGDIACFAACYINGGAAPNCPACSCAERMDGAAGYTPADVAAFVQKLLDVNDPNGTACP